MPHDAAPGGRAAAQRREAGRALAFALALPLAAVWVRAEVLPLAEAPARADTLPLAATFAFAEERVLAAVVGLALALDFVFDPEAFLAGDFAGERRAAAADALLPLGFVVVFALDFAAALALAFVVGLAFVLAGALALALAGLAEARGARRLGATAAELSATGAAVDARVSGGATGATEA